MQINKERKNKLFFSVDHEELYNQALKNRNFVTEIFYEKEKTVTFSVRAFVKNELVLV
jgi:hypothetical protein